MEGDCIYEVSCIDKLFLTQLKELVDVEQYLVARKLSNLTEDDFYEVKRKGFSNNQVAFSTKSNEKEVRSRRLSLSITPAYKRVYTCAGQYSLYVLVL